MRDTVKRLAGFVASMAVAPALLSFAVRARIMGRDRALHASSQLLSLVPGLAGTYLRAAYYASVLEHCDRTACIEFGTVFSKAGARVGARAYIGPSCHIGLADIEEDVLLASGVHVPSGARVHGMASLSEPIREQPGALTRVRIGAGSWVGAGAVVMASVGRGCVIGAGAVVTRELPNAVVAVGVPARVARRRSDGMAAGHV